jgi:hypothetical protein
MARAAAKAEANKPPEALEEVIREGDLAAFVDLDDWEPLRQARRERDDQLSQETAVIRKLAEVEEALAGLDAKRPRDASRMAQALLDGKPLPVESPAAEPTGVGVLGREALAAARSGLLQKQTSCESQLAWLSRRVEEAERKILRGALERPLAVTQS